MNDQIKRYLVVGGNPFYHHCNRGTTAFTNINIVYHGDDKEAAIQSVKDKFDDCGGLMRAVDLLTGEDL